MQGTAHSQNALLPIKANKILLCANSSRKIIKSRLPVTYLLPASEKETSSRAAEHATATPAASRIAVDAVDGLPEAPEEKNHQTKTERRRTVRRRLQHTWELYQEMKPKPDIYSVTSEVIN